ncbi:ABC transporter ATP-binding protein [Haloquadratum walsbyi]|jgi:ABC-type multidrug transport system, ATPase component|uniref:ABC-type multidrug transport system, ATPase component n=1 Tax=Haloquadratum walsbyi J07HQW2 TaxID=1238425 RepID=U1PRD6_9EURY|nr:ABC transporter ATP-binding protein [Haloquadratum walsbyi]ERG96332.1 MAG: ABC-type multidrug transport system, ATPase component [Haloquadratum walsbyi J07HQW2]
MGRSAVTPQETTTEESQDNDDSPALVVDGVSKQFGSGDDAVTAVNDISLNIERGSIVGLLGPNGAGKTTLIKSILGTVLPDTGAIRVLGTNVKNNRRTAYANVDAMLEGARNDYWRLTVRENLRYFATVSGINPDSVATRHAQLLERLDLTTWADTPVRELSRGMKQKVSLASVLAGGAELLFLDEPTLGLDVEGSRTLRTELRRLAIEDGLTVVLSSHNMAVIEDVCDRVIVMADGRIVADSDVETLVETVGGERLQIKSNDLTHSIVSKLRERIEETALTATIDSDPRIEVELSKVSLYELFNILEGSGVEIEDIQTVEVGLEEALIALTSAQSQANTQRQSEAVDRERKEAQSADGEIHTDNSQRSNRAETDVVRSQEHEL